MLPAAEGIIEIVGTHQPQTSIWRTQNEPRAFIISHSTLRQNKYA